MTEENGRPPGEGRPPERFLTANQVVAWNLAWYRRMARMTQAELGAAIGWKKSAVSDAERSVSGQWTREFDAQALVNLAAALGVPAGAFLLPPADDQTAALYYMEVPGTEGCPEVLDMGDLLVLVLPDSPSDTPAMEAYRDRLRAASRRYLEPYWQAQADRWLADAAPPELRADLVARLRMERDEALGHAEEFGRLADALEKAGTGDE